MPPYSSSSPTREKTDLPALIAAALPFLRDELHLVDPDLPALVALVRSAGAGECWHKDGCFLRHLTDVYRILKLWGAPDPVARCGLFHSVYSNSYVDLAIFDPAGGGRDVLRRAAGTPAERLVHLFCVVPRQTLIHDGLIFRYSDAELVDHLLRSGASIRRIREEDGASDAEEPWRRKLRSVLPAEGITAKHIRTGEDVRLSRRMVAVFLLMTMADFSDQLFGFQDELFDNEDGRMEFAGNSYKALWPGDGRPGLWTNSISRMGAVYSLIAREEEIYLEERKKGGVSAGFSPPEDRDEELELVVPPVFENCTGVLGTAEQRAARDLYWEAMSCGKGREERAEELLLGCIDRNPFVGEPHLVLAQLYAGGGRYEESAREAAVGLRLLVEWGSPWDKRVGWEGWVAWGRLLVLKAEERAWPRSAFGIINLGLVR